MAYIAMKPCCFAGQKFRIGDTVPHEIVLPKMAGRLITMGKLVEVPENAPPMPEDDSPMSENNSPMPENDSPMSENDPQTPEKPKRKQGSKSR